jgi:Zn-dependent protease with chaperone function
MLLSLVLFFLVYFGILALCGLFFIWALGSLVFVGVHRGFAFVSLVQLGFCLPVFLLFVYMVKNLCRRAAREKTDHVEIFVDEHPRLFDFIRQVCDETGAPYPSRVFVNHEVNARAFSDGQSLRHLFLPTERNLLIGLGLLGSINLTEFKALLGHEFGHFSQKTLRLGAFVYVAMGIVNQVVDGRDSLDRFIENRCRAGPPLSWPAWGFYGVLWVPRRILMGIRYVMFFYHSGMSRQTEFNADLVAVSVTGSDAPVHLLCRTMLAGHCMEQTIRDLQVAMDHHLHTADLFHHQSRSVSYVRRLAKNPHMGEPPPLPENRRKTTRVFDPAGGEQAAMWSTHPSDFDREQNAKAFYIRSDFDERSPWLLFDNALELRAEVTYRFYRSHLKARRDVIQLDPKEIQAFIDEERAETTFAAQYHGLYDFRRLTLGDIQDMAQEVRRFPWDIAELSQMQAALYNVEVKRRAQLYNKRLQEHALLQAVFRGWHQPTNNEIEFRGEIHDAQDAGRLLQKLGEEFKQDDRWLADLDRRVFLTHFQMARHISEENRRRAAKTLSLPSQAADHLQGPARSERRGKCCGEPGAQPAIEPPRCAPYRRGAPQPSRGASRSASMPACGPGHDYPGPKEPAARAAASAFLTRRKTDPGAQQIRAIAEPKMDQEVGLAAASRAKKSGLHPLQESRRPSSAAGTNCPGMAQPLAHPTSGDPGSRP